MSTYPSLDGVEMATRVQLAHWFRHLPSPGSRAVGKPEFHAVSVAERKVLDRICARFAEVGGFTPEISELISPSTP